MEDEKEFEFIDALLRGIRPPEDSVYLLNLPRIKQMEFCEKAIKRTLEEAGDAHTKVEVVQSIYDGATLGAINVEGRQIDLRTKWFIRAVEFADNTEVYPLANGKVRMTLTFYDTTKKI